MTRLGHTELDVFPLGLGGIPLQKISVEEAHTVIDAAIQGGINFADTGEGYGDSENKLSRALSGNRDEFILASKSPRRSAAGMTKAIDQSLDRLQTDYIDLYQVHNLMTEEALKQIFAPGGAVEALVAAKESGKIRHIGITGHRPSVLVEAVKSGVFETVQVPINAVHREAEEELLPIALGMGLGIIAMKPVGGGTLDTPSLGIRYCLGSPAQVVLCGMKNAVELEENLNTVRSYVPLSEEEEEQLMAEGSQWGDKFCHRCDYCQPCPHGVKIPKILWLANFNRRYGEFDPWTAEEYRAMDITAADCQECGKCEGKCPYELPIINMLKEADSELSPSFSQRARRKLGRVASRIVSRQ